MFIFRGIVLVTQDGNSFFSKVPTVLFFATLHAFYVYCQIVSIVMTECELNTEIGPVYRRVITVHVPHS